MACAESSKFSILARVGRRGLAALSALALFGAGLSPGLAHADGRIVIIGDDYMVSDEYWNFPNNNAQALVDSSLAWLGAGVNDHSALVSSWFDTWLHHSKLYARVGAAGYSETKSATSGWTASTLAGHSLVVASFSAGVNVAAMVNYVHAGGNVLLVTGELQSYQNVKDFASAFGIKVLDTPGPNNSPTGYTTWTSASPVTQGVKSLYFVGPAAMTLSAASPGAALVSGFTQGGATYGVVAVSGVPEPTTWALLAAGLAVLAIRRTRQNC